MSGVIVPFGKFKGQPVEAMAQDTAYCDWLASLVTMLGHQTSTCLTTTNPTLANGQAFNIKGLSASSNVPSNFNAGGTTKNYQDAGPDAVLPNAFTMNFSARP